MTKFTGKTWLYGDDVSTDSILPSKWKTSSFDPYELGKHAMSGIDPEFSSKVSAGDFIVGGLNFGCGSSREQAPLALTGCGVKIIIAKSIARIFFRNCINIGLYPVEVDYPDNYFSQGGEVEVDFDSSTITNLVSGEKIDFRPIPEFLSKLVNAGGLKQFLLGGGTLSELVSAK